MAFPTIQSRVNGLQIAIPPAARGLLGRFATKNGNDLVFVKPRGVLPADAKGGVNTSKALVVEESAAIDQDTPPADLA